MSTYLVTGAAGFIGSHLCDRLLAEGHTVIGLDDLSTGRIANLGEARSYGKRFAFTTIDVRSGGLGTMFQRHQPEVVLHLAAQMDVRRSVADPAHDASVNLMGLLNVLAASAASGVRKVVFASSGGTIYGEPRKLPVKETARRGSRPASPYGITKKVAEDYLAFFRRERGLDYTALALANVYGPRQDPHGEAGVVAIFGARMLAGEPTTIYGEGRQTRDYVFVADAVHAFALAASERGGGQLLNVGTGIETSVNRLHEVLGGIVGTRVEPRHEPARPGELQRSALDAELVGEVLGWKPWTHLEDGLAETVAFLKDTVRR